MTRLHVPEEGEPVRCLLEGTASNVNPQTGAFRVGDGPAANLVSPRSGAVLSVEPVPAAEPVWRASHVVVDADGCTWGRTARRWLLIHTPRGGFDGVQYDRDGDVVWRSDGQMRRPLTVLAVDGQPEP